MIRRPQQVVTRARPAPRQARRRTARNLSYRSSTVYAGTATNAGTTATANFTISIAGPVTPTSIYFTNATQGKTIQLTTVPASGQTLVVDFYARSVTVGGVAVTGAFTTDSRWWDLSAGANTIQSNVGATVGAIRDAFH